ncbi:membrane transporter [Oryctes borbonicus]|uniref:Membrane transporter n=1 Tax=Oryctes borbonicus TaxID=1629725 RepID=A0A0T6B7U5_9SCAR|nr:membrane transporter [Oryctes borbonicus]
MLTIVGSMSNIGELCSSLLSGYVSDKYGRKTLMIAAVLWTTFAGLTRSFTPSYLPFVIMEFLDTFLGSGFYSAGFVLAMELVIPEQRVWGNTILACAFVAGEVVLGMAAWVSQSWRVMLRILYGPGIFFISYIWLTHESIRWLLSKGRYQEAKRILKKIAKVNGTQISEETIAKLNKVEDDPKDVTIWQIFRSTRLLLRCYQEAKRILKKIAKVNGTQISEETIAKLNKIKDDPKDVTIWQIFRSTRLLLRLINCSFSWICSTFVYYGLTLHSVSISGNMYVNYIAVAAVEIPAFFVCNYTLGKLGRRFTLSPSYILSGIACLSFIFVSDGMDLKF